MSADGSPRRKNGSKRGDICRKLELDADRILGRNGTKRHSFPEMNDQLPGSLSAVRSPGWRGCRVELHRVKRQTQRTIAKQPQDGRRRMAEKENDSERDG